MLRVNLACELAAMLGMFLLVYHWIRVCHRRPPDRWWLVSSRDGWGRDEVRTSHLPSTVGLFSATLAALLLWFNPALILNAHVYPQWDAWLLPPLIFALYFGLRDWWLPAGVVVGICAMAKGQILFVLPVLIAWPLLMGHFAGALRVAIGVLTGVALVVWPWLLQSYEAAHWMLFVTVGTVLLVMAAMLPRTPWWQGARFVLALTGAGVVLWPVAEITGQWVYGNAASGMVLHRRTTLVSVIMLAVAAAIAGGRVWVPTILAGFPSLCAMLTIPLLKSTTAWFDIGTVFPTRNWEQLYWCRAANLGTILQVRFGWSFADFADLSWIPLMTDAIPIRHVMIWAYVMLLAVCVFGIVRQRRWHDPRLLLAFALPLMLAYAFLPQMIERYLIWPAAMLSGYAAVSLAAGAIWLALSSIAVLLMLGYMLSFAQQTQVAKDWMPITNPIFPDISWAVIVLALVMLYLACTPSRRRPWEPEARPAKPPTMA